MTVPPGGGRGIALPGSGEITSTTKTLAYSSPWLRTQGRAKGAARFRVAHRRDCAGVLRRAGTYSRTHRCAATERALQNDSGVLKYAVAAIAHPYDQVTQRRPCHVWKQPV